MQERITLNFQILGNNIHPTCIFSMYYMPSRKQNCKSSFENFTFFFFNSTSNVVNIFLTELRHMPLLVSTCLYNIVIKFDIPKEVSEVFQDMFRWDSE